MEVSIQKNVKNLKTSALFYPVPMPNKTQCNECGTDFLDCVHLRLHNILSVAFKFNET